MNELVAPVEINKAYRLINHGPTVLVSASHSGIKNVMAAAWVCALDYAPGRLTAILDKSTKTRDLIEQSGKFGIQIPTVAQVELTRRVGSKSLTEDPDKLTNCGVELFEFDSYDFPFVQGCSAWLACKVIPEPHNQETYDLFIGEVIAAWSDTRVFKNGHWNYENAPDELRSIHHVAGGNFFAIGKALNSKS